MLNSREMWESTGFWTEFTGMTDTSLLDISFNNTKSQIYHNM